MTDKEIAIVDDVTPISEPVAQMALVGELSLKGRGLREISKELDIPYATAKAHLQSWKESLKYSEYASVKAKDAVFEADNHYGLIKKEAWRVADEAKNDGDRRNELASLKLAGDIEGRRVDMLRTAGLLENSELASQMLETERKQEILVNIMRNIMCDKCKREVAAELSKITGLTERIG